MSIRTPFVLVLLLLSNLLSSPGLAAADDGFELGVLAGIRTGSATLAPPIACIAADEAPCPDDPRLEDGGTLGLVFGLPVGERWRLEIFLDRQETELELDFASCPECNTIDLQFGDVELTSLHVGLQRRWRLARARPFVGLGVGVTRVETAELRFGLVDIDEERASASLGIGVVIPLADWLGLRFEGRGYWIDLPTGDFQFDDELTQGQLAAGLTFHW